MKISARNQIKGKISKIINGVVSSEVIIDVDKKQIKASITKEAVKDLGLKKGEEAYAIIKSSSVLLSKKNPGAISARNVFKCKVVEIIEGVVNNQIKLKSGKLQLSTTITKEASEELNLKAKSTAYAIIKASSVLVALD